jgi:hypothetical protein
MAAATIRSLSARNQRRRRCTDVITSTCALVIGLALGFALGLNQTTHLSKAASPDAYEVGGGSKAAADALCKTKSEGDGDEQRKRRIGQACIAE